MRGFGIVRDAQGRPKFDGDPMKAHPGILMSLTPEEKQQLGVWDGPMATDAQGTKRLRKLPNGDFEAVDALVALSEVFDGDAVFKARQRVDVPEGGTVKVGG